MEDELQQQEDQIEEASENLKKKNLVKDNEDDEKMKKELESFMKKFDIKDVTELMKLKK